MRDSVMITLFSPRRRVQNVVQESFSVAVPTSGRPELVSEFQTQDL